MLVLTRRAGESIDLSGGITVTVVKIDLHDRKVRLGITAPDDVHVTRPDAIKKAPRPRVRRTAA